MWKRAFFGYEQISLKGRVYKGLFYAFTFFSVMGTAAAISVATPAEWVFGLLGGAFYLFIGLAFRRAAIRTYDAEKEKAAETQVDG